MGIKIPYHLILIGMAYVMLYYVSSVLDHKLVGLWIFHVPAPFLYFSFIYILSDAVTEVYGPKMTWAFLISGYIVTVLFSFLTVAIIGLPNPPGNEFLPIQANYNFLSSTILKCLGDGYLAFFIGIFINVKLLSRWKLKYKGKHYYWRSLGSTCISEAVVTVIAQFLIWGNRLPLQEVIHTIVYGYPFIMVMTILWAFLGSAIKNILYMIEGKEKYEYNRSFSV
jgi:uncharacterized integral membrane protein (TIGR00697 family)